MNAKKLSIAVGAVSLLGLGSAAFAADPIQVSCPAGSEQQLVSGENIVCKDEQGTPVAGPMVMLYPSGKKMAEGQVDARGFRTGTWTLFNERGVKTHVIQFARGTFDGKWVEFHANGQPKKVVQYAKGMRVGQPELFDPTGKVVVTR